MGAPARICTSNLRLRTATCRALTPRELGKTTSCRCRPGPCGLEDPRRVVRQTRCYINDAGLEMESDPRLFGICVQGFPSRRADFSLYEICLSPKPSERPITIFFGLVSLGGFEIPTSICDDFHGPKE